MRALVTGATGFIGRRLIASLQSPAVLARDPERAKRELGLAEAYPWDAEGGPPPVEAFRGVEAVFHLAGDPVAKGRWSEAKKERIRRSRVLGTRNLVAAIAALREKPKVLVSASAVGYYGSRGDELLEEGARPGDDFLAGVCREWEDEARAAEKVGVRAVSLRIGIVLGRGGGALSRMLTPFKLGLGGRLGDGRQWFPWVHIDDVVGLFCFAAESPGLRGPVNAVAPGLVTNRDFTVALARALRRPALFPAPAFALKAALGEFGTVLLSSQRVLPRAAEKAGYRFRFPRLEEGLLDILSIAPSAVTV